MPHRPTSHVVADRAIAAVSSICADAGLACERVMNDYGEDLVVQPSFNGIVDPFRLYLQVKGTMKRLRSECTDTRCCVRVGTRHFAKWMNSIDPMIVVLWSVAEGEGCWLHIDYRTPERYTQNRASVSIELRGQQQFTPSSINRFVWEARLAHYESIVTLCLRYEEQEDGGTHGKIWRARAHDAVENFLQQLGIIQDDGLTIEFLSANREEIEIARNHASLPVQSEAVFAMLRAFLRHVQRHCDLGVPCNLAMNCGIDLAALVALGCFEEDGTAAGWLVVERGRDDKKRYHLASRMGVA